MTTWVASSEVPSYRDTRDYRLAVRRYNKPFKAERNETHLQNTPRNSSYQCKRQSPSNAKSNSSQICKYWMNENCAYGDFCWSLHSWFHGEHLSVLTRLNQHKKMVTGITLPVGSDKLFSSSTNGTLRMWDCHTGQCVSVMNLGDEARCLISMDPWVIVGIRNVIKAWNIQTATEVTLDGPKGDVLSMFVCNNTLFARAMDGVIYAWRPSSEANFPFKPLAMLNGHNKAVVCLNGGRGDKLYSGSIDHSIKDLNTLQCTMTLKGHSDVVTSLICWDQYLLSSALDDTVKVWGATEKETLEVVYTHNEKNGVVRINGMVDAQGKHTLFCSCNNHSVGLYEMPTFEARGRLFSKKEIRVIEEGPDGLFFTGEGTGSITIWKWLAELEPGEITSP